MSELTGQTASAARKQNPPLEAIYDRVCNHNSRLADILAALSNAVDKIVGPIPAEAIEVGAEPPTNNSIAKIGGMLDAQDSIVRGLSEEVQRVVELG